MQLPCLEGEGRLPEQSEGSRGGVNLVRFAIHPTPLALLATLPLQGRVKRACRKVFQRRNRR